MPRWVDPVPDLKRRLADELLALTEGQSLVWAAWRTHLSRSRISEIRRGNLVNVSLERLVQAVSFAGRRVHTWPSSPRTDLPVGTIDFAVR